MPFHFQGVGPSRHTFSLAHSVAPSSARTKTKATASNDEEGAIA